jgi:hypothetical protein
MTLLLSPLFFGEADLDAFIIDNLPVLFKPLGPITIWFPHRADKHISTRYS